MARSPSGMDRQAVSAATSSLLSSISRLCDASDIADFTLICGEKRWRLHSAILAIRSPFFKAAIANNLAEKSKMEIEIKELAPEAMEQVINFMYGKPIGEAPFNSLLEASERFQMEDMKKEVIRIGSRILTSNSGTALEIGRLAELYNIEQLLQESAELIVKNEIEVNEDDLGPKLNLKVLGIFKETVKDGKRKEKRSAEVAQELQKTKKQKVRIEIELEKTKKALTKCQDSLSANNMCRCGDKIYIGGKCINCHFKVPFDS